MISKTIQITSEGLRSQPAATIVQAACKYSCLIMIEYKEKCINAKSMMGVFSLGASAGDELKLTADGEDEAQAIDELVEIISNVNEQAGE